jgi:putative spermidine/putrescine transport system substrate-binding protein/spermidine/putrescine transport system substrate-binding protein
MRFRKNSILILLFSLMTFFASTLLAEEQKVLRITGWDVYGDPDYPDKTIGFKSFEQQTGVTIDFHPLSNMDEIVSAAEAEEDHDHDVFIISNEGIRILHDMGLVSPLNLKALPHYQNLHHNLKYSEWSQFDSRIYAVPWAWGPTGLMYNTDIISEPDSWNTLWDPKYKGKVAMWDDVSMIWTAALALGYQNVYSLTRMQLENVKKKLFEFNDLSAIYYKGGGDEQKLAMQGKIVAFNSWYDPSAQLKKAGKNFAMIIPKEGAVGMFDSYMINKKSNLAALAHQYINHQISPAIQRQMVSITGLAPANIETLALLKPNEIKALHLDEEDYFNRMLLWDHMPRKNLYEKVLEAVRDDIKQKR